MNDNNLALKIYTIESDQRHLNEKMDKMESSIESNTEVTYDIKERLDKWDGFMPHMIKQMDELSVGQKEIHKSLVSKDLENSEMTTKFKVLWTLLGFLGAAIVGFVVRAIEKHFS
jgi:hypothetical protein